MTLTGVTLLTLLDALKRSGTQAQALQAIYLKLGSTGRTSDVVENIGLELQRCCEMLEDEIKQLRKYGEDVDDGQVRSVRPVPGETRR